MRKICVIFAALVLSGCQTHSNLPPVPPTPPPTSEPPPVAPAHPPLPPVHSAGPLTKAGVGVYMDAQEADLRSYLHGQGVPVARRGDNLALIVSTDRIFDKDQISTWGDALLQVFQQVLGHYDHTAIDVTCYTDAKGGDQVNLALSQTRAKAFVDALARYGIASTRLTANGLGAANPRSTNPDDPRNRRIEIKITPVPK